MKGDTMSKTSTFLYSNTEAGAHDVDQVALGLTTNYAIASEREDVVKLNNKTAPIDAEEIIELRYRELDQLKTYANNTNAMKLNSGIEYSVRIDDILTTTDSDNPGFRVDEPIICAVTIRHPKSGNISGTQVFSVFQRAISALMKEDGTWRFDDLMRSAERPITD
jgi:hypothetical protein